MSEKRDVDFWMSEEFPRGDLVLNIEVLQVLAATTVEGEREDVVRFRAVPLAGPGPLRERPIDPTD